MTQQGDGDAVDGAARAGQDVRGPDDIVIRTADGNDLDGVVRVGNSVMRSANAGLMEPEVLDLLAAKFWTSDANTASIRAGRTFVGGAGPNGSDIVAWASYVKQHDRVTIWKLYVLPEYGGRGVARRLVEAIVEKVRTHHGSVYLAVHEGSEEALAFANAIGFEEIEREEQSGMPRLVWLRRNLCVGGEA